MSKAEYEHERHKNEYNQNTATAISKQGVPHNEAHKCV